MRRNSLACNEIRVERSRGFSGGWSRRFDRPQNTPIVHRATARAVNSGLNNHSPFTNRTFARDAAPMLSDARPNLSVAHNPVG
ncbi:MAG: hypothetical protein DWQ29_13465, partial [Planctomycetota bacterium]